VLSALALAVAVAAGVAAQDDPPPGEVAVDAATAEQPRFEGEVEVTAPPILAGTTVDRYAQSVATVSQRQVEELNAQDLTAALRRVPGVTVSRFNPIGAFGGAEGGALFVRGHGSGRPGAEIATLVEGIPRFVGIWTHPLVDQQSLDPVDEIRVYRSPQPVLLGSMGFAAVDMVGRRVEAPGVEGRVRGGYGSDATLVGAAEAGGRSGALDWLVTASHRGSDGHRPNAGGEVEAASGRLGCTLGDRWDLSLRLDWTDAWADDPEPVGAPPQPVVERYATDAVFAVATLGHHHRLGDGHLKLWLDHGDLDWLQWDAVAAEPFESLTASRNWGARLRETLLPWAGGELLMGIDHDDYGGEFVEQRPAGPQNPNDVRLRATAPYVMVSHVFDGRVTVTPSAGVRFTESDPYGGHWGGQVGLKLAFASTELYANAAHAFNLPGAWAAVQYAGWGLGDRWQDLDPEVMDHVEVGLGQRITDRVRLDLSVFRDEVEDGLRFVPPPPPPPSFANVGAYTVRGVEVAVEAMLGSRSALFVGGTWSDPDPDDVPNLPAGTAALGFSHAFPGRVRLNLDAEWSDLRYVDNPRFPSPDRTVDAYWLLNARLGAPIELLFEGLGGEVYLAGENLADEEYEYRPGYPMPGRTVMAGLELRF
jgi:iron complex outermembrane receptor protein